MLEDILSDTWLYKKLQKQAEEKGREEGREEGKLEGMRLVVLDIVQDRFPEMMDMVEKELDNINDPALLRRLILKMDRVPDAHEAARALFRIAEGEEGQ